MVIAASHRKPMGKTRGFRASRSGRPLNFEPLESRTLLDAAASNIVVGRTLSTHTMEGIANHQVTITYTLYNLQADPETGATISTTLAPGLSVASTTGQPSQVGQGLNWNVGTIPGFGRSSVTVTVNLPNASTLQLDTGARGAATLNGASVSDLVPAAALRSGSVNPALLAATADADTNDPYIQRQAALLDYDPQRIFDFLHTQVAYESYLGSLRGARGTLWSDAGNSLDVASLGVALMRASGVPARYVRGDLGLAPSRQLIASMFPDPLRVLGYVDQNVPKSDPSNDPRLLAEAQDHFWFQFDAGAGFRDADPLMPGASVGQTFATPAGSPFPTVPDALEHKVTFTLDAETYNSGAALFGAGLGQTTVLSETFNTVSLVGKTVSVGNFLSTSGIGAILSATTYTYTPYIRIHDITEPTSTDIVISDTPYQQILTNFPFGTQILTGLFLHVTTQKPTSPAGDPASQTYDKTLYDRIGFAARRNGQAGAIATEQDLTVPPVTELDITTLAVTPSRIPTEALFAGTASLAGLQSQLDQLSADLASSDPNVVDAAQPRMQALSRDSAVVSMSLIASMFINLYDQFLNETTGRMLVKSYVDSARVIAVSTTAHLVPDHPEQTTQEIIFDDLSNPVRNLGYPGQANSIVENMGIILGVGESVIESQVFTILGPAPGLTTTSAYDTIRAALDAGATLLVFGPGDQNQIASLPFSDEAKARISATLDAGRSVLVPSQAVVINGKPVIAWFDLDQNTRRMIAVSEDGNHVSSAELSAIYARMAFQISLAASATMALAQRQAGLFAVQITRFFIESQVAFARWGILTQQALQRAQAAAEKVLLESAQWIENPELRALVEEEYRRVVPEVVANYSHAYNVDPPVGGFIDSPDPNAAFANLGAGVSGPLAMAVTPDLFFTVPFQGAQLKTAFVVGIKNQSGQDQTFDLAATRIPAGFKAILSVSSIRIPAGATAEVGFYLVPISSLDAPGTDISFSVTATSQTDPTVTATVDQSLTLPEVHGVTLQSTPAILSATPGGSTTATLLIRSVGNVPETVDLSSLPLAGLTITGLGVVTLGVGETKSVTITFTPDATVPLNTVFAPILSASFGGARPETLVVSVRTEVPGAAAIVSAEASATLLGQPGLADRLKDLGTSLTNLVQEPTNPVYKGQALASLDSVIAQLNADPQLTPLAADLTAARGALVSAADPAAVQAATTALGNALNTLGARLSDLARHRFQLSFLNSSQVAQPQTPASFQVVLKNVGTETTTYHLSLEGLSPGLTGQLSQTTVTLAPGATSLAVIATITPDTTVDFSSLGFLVRATADGSPFVTGTLSGSFTARREFVSVVAVTTDPPFVNPGGSVAVSTRVLNAVNREQTVKASYVVRNASNQVVFTSAPVDVTLGITTSIATVSLGNLDTTGLSRGAYSITVTLTDANGQPIAGGTGEGSLLVGSPVSATLTADKDLLPPGSTTVTSTLTVTAQTTLIGPLGVVSQTDVPNASGVARSGNFVYVSNPDGIRAFDVTNPAAPQLTRTFGFSATLLEVHGDKLYALTRNGASNRFFLRIYSLANPSDPQFLGSATYNNAEGIPYGLAWHMVVTDTTVFVSHWGFTFLLPNDIKYQLGELVSIDVSDPTAPRFIAAMRNTYGTNEDHVGQYLNVDNTGGDGALWEVAQVDANTLLITGSTAVLDDTQNGKGVVYVVDISDPAHMTIVRTVEIPGTVHAVGLEVVGNRAFVTGSTTGWQDQGLLDFTGNTVLATLDITDPRNPTVLGTKQLDRSSRGPADLFTAAIDATHFVFSSRYEDTDTEASSLFVVDTSDPANPTYNSTPIPAFTSHLAAQGNYVYTTSTSGLIIYQLDAADTIPVTVSVDLPNTGGSSVVPGSFSIAPTRIIAGAGFDTYQWDLGLNSSTSTQTITWQTNVQNLRPGETRTIASQPNVTFTVQGTDGAVPLSELNVAGQQILGLDPASRTIRPGETTTFTLDISNPTSTAVTYAMAVRGVPVAWTNLPSTLTIPAGGTVHQLVTFKADNFAALGDYGFVITATTTDGIEGSAQGTLTLDGAALPLDTDSHGFLVSLLVSQVAVGPGSPARYTVRIHNTGSSPETVSLQALGLPTGFSAMFDQPYVTVSPGVNNFIDVGLMITPPAGTRAVVIPFQVSASKFDTSAQTEGSLRVLAVGAKVTLSPATAAPGATLQMTVTNSGTVAETFLLSLGGPASVGATIDVTQVRLEPGASTTVAVHTSTLLQAVPGGLPLVAMATAVSDPTARGSALAQLTFPTTSGMNAALTPDTRALATPGTATFLIKVTNTGNIQDKFTASIEGVSGPVSAYLVNGDGSLALSPLEFALTGLGSGTIPLQAVLTGPGTGLVTIRLTSTTNPALSQTVTARVTSPTEPPPPPPPPPPPTTRANTTTRLVATPETFPAGQAVTLTATVAPTTTGGPTPTGPVAFVIDGQLWPVRGHLTIVAGQAVASVTITGLSAGTHTIQAIYEGDPSNAPSSSSIGSLNVEAAPPVTVDGPRVQAVLRFGYHFTPTTLVIHFDQALDPARAQDVRNYQIMGPSGPLQIRLAIYDPAALTVTLHPRQLINLHVPYQLTIIGTGAGGLTSATGKALDGLGNGQPGSDHRTTLTAANLVFGPPSTTATIFRLGRKTRNIPTRRFAIPAGPRHVLPWTSSVRGTAASVPHHHPVPRTVRHPLHPATHLKPNKRIGQEVHPSGRPKLRLPL